MKLLVSSLVGISVALSTQAQVSAETVEKTETLSAINSNLIAQVQCFTSFQGVKQCIGPAGRAYSSFKYGYDTGNQFGRSQELRQRMQYYSNPPNPTPTCYGKMQYNCTYNRLQPVLVR